MNTWTTTIGKPQFHTGDFVYIWIRSKPTKRPIYVGETAQSQADRGGLHLRVTGSKQRSGAIVGALICKYRLPRQEFTIMNFPLSAILINSLIEENKERKKARKKANLRTMARRAIEYEIFQRLAREYRKVVSAQKERKCSWTATTASDFANRVINAVRRKCQ
jgi:hypothetical protein